MTHRPKILLTGLLVLLLVLVACDSNDPSKTVTQGDELLIVSFDSPGSWEEGTYFDEAGMPDTTLAITEGRYQIDYQAGRSASFTWGAGGAAYDDVIVEVEIEQLSSEKDNLYGVLCRLITDEMGEQNGYALLLSGDGHYGIAKFQDESLTFLLPWHQSEKIRQGRAVNTLRAVCVDDYFAIYANDTFLGEVQDTSLRETGQIGLIAGATGNAAISVAFDNLTVYEGTLP